MGGVEEKPEPERSAGWFPDPWGAADRRWWNGSSWTSSTFAGTGPNRHRRRLNGRVRWAVLGAAAIVSVALSVAGLLAYTGAFDEPEVGHILSVKTDGDTCLRLDSGTKVYCVDDGGETGLEPGDCVEVFDRHGLEIDRRIPCPR